MPAPLESVHDQQIKGYGSRPRRRRVLFQACGTWAEEEVWEAGGSRRIWRVHTSGAGLVRRGLPGGGDPGRGGLRGETRV